MFLHHRLRKDRYEFQAALRHLFCLDDDLMLNFNVHIDSDRFLGAATSMRGVQPTSIKDDVKQPVKFSLFFLTLFSLRTVISGRRAFCSNHAWRLSPKRKLATA